jgi:DNA-binding transcriptional LysR family regulator
MELRHIRYVIAVAEELNFCRAAERLNMSQPPLSHQIRLLEEELGVKLFERSKRHVQLTEAGVRFVEEGRKVLAQVDHAAKVAVSTSRGEVGHLSIGMLWERRIVVDSVRIFAKRHPDVHVDLHRTGGHALIKALKEGRLQVGFSVLFGSKDQSLVYETLSWEPIVLGLPEKHPLAVLEKVPLRSLASEQYIMFHREVNPALYDEIIAVCRNSGFSLNIVHEADSIYSSMALVAAGLGVALFPASVGDVERKGIVFRELQGRLPKMESMVVYKRDMPLNIVRTFLDVVRQCVQRASSRRRYAVAMGLTLPVQLFLQSFL